MHAGVCMGLYGLQVPAAAESATLLPRGERRVQRLTQPAGGLEDATVPPATTLDAAAAARVFVGRPLSASRVDGLRTGSTLVLAPLRPDSSPTHALSSSDGEHNSEEDSPAPTSPRETTDGRGILASRLMSTPSLLGLSAVLSVPVATMLGEY
jgi:hypothetical protein